MAIEITPSGGDAALDLFIEGKAHLRGLMSVIEQANKLAAGTAHEARMAAIFKHTMLIHREAGILGREIGGDVAARTGGT